MDRKRYLVSKCWEILAISRSVSPENVALLDVLERKISSMEIEIFASDVDDEFAVMMADNLVKTLIEYLFGNEFL